MNRRPQKLSKFKNQKTTKTSKNKNVANPHFCFFVCLIVTNQHRRRRATVTILYEAPPLYVKLLEGIPRLAIDGLDGLLPHQIRVPCGLAYLLALSGSEANV